MPLDRRKGLQAAERFLKQGKLQAALSELRQRSEALTGELRRRLDRNRDEQQQLSDVSLQAEINELQRREADGEAGLQVVRERVEERVQSISHLRERNQQTQDELAALLLDLDEPWLIDEVAFPMARMDATVLEDDDERHPKFDPRYAGIEGLPGAESLKLTLERVLPCWTDVIAPDLKAGKNVLIAAHGNSLRALVKMLDEALAGEAPAEE